MLLRAVLFLFFSRTFSPLPVSFVHLDLNCKHKKTESRKLLCFILLISVVFGLNAAAGIFASVRLFQTTPNQFQSFTLIDESGNLWATKMCHFWVWNKQQHTNDFLIDRLRSCWGLWTSPPQLSTVLWCVVNQFILLGFFIVTQAGNELTLWEWALTIRQKPFSPKVKGQWSHGEVRSQFKCMWGFPLTCSYLELCEPFSRM